MVAVYIYWCRLSPVGSNRCGEDTSGKETIGLFELNIPTKLHSCGVGWCSFVVTNIISNISEYRTITHSVARFNTKANLENMLRIREDLYYAGFELNIMTHHLYIAEHTKEKHAIFLIA